MRIRFNSGKSDMNWHGGHEAGNPSKFTTVHGWKLKVFDLRIPNPGTTARWYKRFILYRPSGAWMHLDVALIPSR